MKISAGFIDTYDSSGNHRIRVYNTLGTIGLYKQDGTLGRYSYDGVYLNGGSIYNYASNELAISAPNIIHFYIGDNKEIIGANSDTIYMYENVNMSGHEILNCANFASDRRLKKDIKDTEISAIDRIKQIKHKRFIWKKDGKQEAIGYIAQELEEIDKNYVRRNIEKDKEGKITSDMYEIRILPILSTATKAIQEQQKIIEHQDETIQGLLRRLEKLEKEVVNAKN